MWDTYEWYLLFHCGAVLRGKCTDNSVRHYLEQNFTGLQWNGRKFFRFLSRSLDYGSMSYELVIWDIYEWYLLCHGGAVLRGGRKPIAALPNVAVQTAWSLPSSTSGSMTGPQWNRRSFFHFHHWVIWTDEAWVWSWVIWEIYVLYLLFLCEAVLRGMGDIYSWFCHIIAELCWVEPPPPGVAQYDLDHCHVGDYNLGSCGTSMRDICYFFAEQYWEAWGNFWKRSVSLLLGVLFVFGFCLLCGGLFGFCLVIVTRWLLSHLLKATI